jgi:protein-L-isoaspartate(D-aspartate) O-methyltransferase
MVNDLIRYGYLRTDTIVDAFSHVRRVSFVPDDLHAQAEANIALPIGFGQTISQPLTVAFMLELLDPQKNQNILDVGSGSGWTTSLLAYISGENGHVTGIEIIGELCDLGAENAQKYGYIKNGMVEFVCGSGKEGFEKNAPYDRILVSAAVRDIPLELKKQLAIGGKMVIPVGHDVWYLEKIADDDFKVEKYPGFSFVPFVEKRGALEY